MSYKKYYVYKEKVSYDGGVTWSYTGNEAPSGNPVSISYETLTECQSASLNARYRWVDTDSGITIGVKECEDYPQLSIPRAIADGVIINDNGTSAIPSGTTEVTYGNPIWVARVPCPIICTFGGTCTDVDVNNYASQILIGCSVETASISVNGNTNWNFGPIILKETQLDSLSMSRHSSSDTFCVYAPDWALPAHRAAYMIQTTLNKPCPHIMVFPVTDYPIPILSTEYTTVEDGYVCSGTTKYEKLLVEKGDGTTLDGYMLGEQVGDC